MSKKINFEKELKNLYRNEADHFRMPDENNIEAIRNAKALIRTTKKPMKAFQYGSLIASAAAVLLLIIAILLLHLPGNNLPNNSISSTQPNKNNSAVSNTENNITPTQYPIDNPKKDYPDLATLSLTQWLSSDRVVWAAGSPTKGSISSGKIIELGQILIDDKLISAFNENDEDTVYAVMVDFTSMCNDDFVFEGQKISEWVAEKDRLIALKKMVDAKLIAQKISQAKEVYYFSMLEKFKETFASMGLGIYHEDRGCTIDNCIFYTFATRSQIEEFACDSTQAFIFSSAVRFK